MITLKDYVNWGLTHCDKTGSAEGVPLVMEKCVKNKRMKQLEVYGNCVQNGTPTPEAPVEVESVGELVTDVNDTNHGKYKIPVTARGKNIFNCKNSKSLYNGNVSGNRVEITATGVAWTPHSVASFVHLDLGLASYYEGKTLVASFDVDVLDGELFDDSRFVLCDTDGSNRTAISGTIVNENEHYHIKSTLAESNYGEKHLTLRLYIRNATAYQKYEVKNIMVAESDTDIHFEPYVEPQTTSIYLNEPLRKIGDYADVVDFKEKKVVRKIYENVMSMIDHTVFRAYTMTAGTLVGIRLQYRPEYSHLYMPTDSGLHVSYYALCNQYPVVSANKRGEHTVSGSTSAMNILDIIDSDYTTVDEWDTHIRDMYETGTPLILTQALRTPYEELIECELPTLPAKTTVIDISTSVQPSNIKGKYIKR